MNEPSLFVRLKGREGSSHVFTKMVTSRNLVKTRKKPVKVLNNLKNQNAKTKPQVKSVKVSNKKLKRNRNIDIEITQVSGEKENPEDTKLENKKPGKEVQKEISSTKKSILRQRQKRSIFESESVKNTEVENFIGKKELQDEKSTKAKSNKVSKHTLKRKSITKNDLQNNRKLTLRANTVSESVKLQKRKRSDSTSEKENTDCLNLNDLSKEHILQCISAIFHLNEEQLKNKNALFDGESQPVFMQVTCIRVPKTPRRCMRILLPHSLVLPNDEVALFVGDLQRGKRKDYEPTVEHYEDLLHKHGCTRIKSIIPMNQVKTEYDQFELKRKLVGSYDYFLIDGKIAGHLSHLLGREFYKKRKLPTSIRMQSKDLKHEIEYALRKTVMQMHSNGDTHTIQVGHSYMKKDEILENILATCSYLSKNYPGGWANIRSVRIKTPSSLALPIYTTLKNKNLVDVPVVQPKRPKAYHDVSGELTTAFSVAAVTVTPEGDIIVEKTSKSSSPQKE